MSQHTPGTWTVSEQESGRIYICSDDNLALAGMFFTAHPESARDDARLMAAAPDLLAALQDVRAAYQAMFDIMPVAWQTLDDICAQAIAKATEYSTHA